MVKITNIFGDEYSGKVGQSGVFAKWKGRQYRRKYVIPANPKTVKQLAVRGTFSDAVDEWHEYDSLQHKAYGYLAAGKVMSGYNLLVSRYQKAAIGGGSLPVKPKEGIKQMCSAQSDISAEACPNGVGPHTLVNKPEKIGSLIYTPSGGDPAVDAYIDVDRGLVRIPANLTGDLTIDYEAAGRIITNEALKTDPQAGDKLYTEYWPVDFETVEVKLSTVVQDCIEVDNRNGKIKFTETAPTSGSATVDYTKYTPIEDVKLQDTKVDTSFITWRDYSDADGYLMLAQTIEDQNYDQIIDAVNFLPETRANRSAAYCTQEELIELTAA